MGSGGFVGRVALFLPLTGSEVTIKRKKEPRNKFIFSYDECVSFRVPFILLIDKQVIVKSWTAVAIQIKGLMEIASLRFYLIPALVGIGGIGGG